MNAGNNNLSKKEQNKINSKTICGGVSGALGFGGKRLSNGTLSGGAAILRSDGQYHTESLEELETQGIFAI